MMNTAPFWASMALLVPAILADPSATTTSAAAESTCTASLITTLCDYEKPGPEFAVASSGRSHCWGYCNDNPPCDFVIFRIGNPYTGSGTCWLYPGQTYDESKGTTDCGPDGGSPYLDVFSKPVCAGTPTTSGACAATASPSAVAKVCGYEPPETCWDTCIASSGATQCLSACAEADSCAYAIFNPHNDSNTPYARGTCWVYTNGTFDAGATTPCTGDAEQYVYDNVCPKPVKPSSSAKASSSTKASGGTGTAGATPGSTGGAATGSGGTASGGAASGDAATGSDSTEAGDDTTDSVDSTALGADGTDAAEDTTGTTTVKKKNSAVGLSLTSPFAVGAAVLLCLAL